MAHIKWESDHSEALARAAQSGKPVYHDFWFQG